MADNQDSDPAKIRYRCNHCGGDIESPESMIGQIDVCPNCRARIQVPDVTILADIPEATILADQSPPAKKRGRGLMPKLWSMVGTRRRTRQIIVIAAAIIIIVMCLFPPWIQARVNLWPGDLTWHDVPAGCHFITWTPTPPVGHARRSRIDGTRLVVQIIPVVVAAGVAIWLLRDRHEPSAEKRL